MMHTELDMTKLNGMINKVVQMPKQTRKNASSRIEPGDIEKFNSKLKELKLTKKKFCKQYGINYSTLRTGISMLKLPQNVFAVISDFINDGQQQVRTTQSTQKDDIFAIIQRMAPLLYKQITDPANIFLTLSHKDSDMLLEITNKIVKDVSNIVSTVGLENEETGKYTIVVVANAKSKDELVKACNKYVGYIEID